MNNSCDTHREARTSKSATAKLRKGKDKEELSLTLSSVSKSEVGQPKLLNVLLQSLALGPRVDLEDLGGHGLFGISNRRPVIRPSAKSEGGLLSAL